MSLPIINTVLKSVLLHLRLPFSLLLLPVYLFALGMASNVNNTYAVVVFVVLHFFIYPASNAYNSYFDKDEDSIALIKNPPKTTRSLYLTAISLEWVGVFLALFVNIYFAICVLVFNFLSKAYSHPSVRLKKHPLISFLVIFIFQGAFIYYSCFFAFSQNMISFSTDVFIAGLICSCLIGASYPLTQIYQHAEDAKRGDQTLSILLGYKGSFAFSGLVFFTGTALMFYYWLQKNQLFNFYVFVVCCLPIMVYFVWWLLKVLKNTEEANFKNAMRMTFISGAMMLLYFTWLWLAS